MKQIVSARNLKNKYKNSIVVIDGIRFDSKKEADRRERKPLNYYALKKIREKINTQKLKVAAARDQAVSLSASCDGTPHGGSVSDRVGIGVGKVISEEEKLNALYDQLTEGIKSVPDEYIKTLVHCKLVKCWSWTRIAQEIGGGNTGDGIRKRCVRYHW